MIIHIAPGDSRLGDFTAEGGVARWPDLDVFGRAYDRFNATVLPVGEACFVVIPPDQGQHIEAIRLLPAAVEKPTRKGEDA